METFTSLYQFSFLVAVFVCGFFTVRITIPPNRTPVDRVWRNDSLRLESSKAFLVSWVVLLSVIVLYHAALTVSNAKTLAIICPADPSSVSPQQRNPELFKWSTVTVFSFLTILVGAPLRMGAFNNLGQDFTFGLAKPSRLATDGIYAYIQHPSYMGLAMVVAACFSVFFTTRWCRGMLCACPVLAVGSGVEFDSVCGCLDVDGSSRYDEGVSGGGDAQGAVWKRVGGVAFKDQEVYSLRFLNSARTISQRQPWREARYSDIYD